MSERESWPEGVAEIPETAIQSLLDSITGWQWIFHGRRWTVTPREGTPSLRVPTVLDVRRHLLIPLIHFPDNSNDAIKQAITCAATEGYYRDRDIGFLRMHAGTWWVAPFWGNAQYKLPTPPLLWFGRLLSCLSDDRVADVVNIAAIVVAVTGTVFMAVFTIWGWVRHPTSWPRMFEDALYVPASALVFPLIVYVLIAILIAPIWLAHETAKRLTARLCGRPACDKWASDWESAPLKG